MSAKRRELPDVERCDRCGESLYKCLDVNACERRALTRDLATARRDLDLARARVAELERAVALREAQTQRMMLARDAMQRERDEARSGGWNHARAEYWTERAEKAEAQVATLRAALEKLLAGATCVACSHLLNQPESGPCRAVECQCSLPHGATALFGVVRIGIARAALAGTAPAPLSEQRAMLTPHQQEQAARARYWLKSAPHEAEIDDPPEPAPLSERERALVVVARAFLDLNLDGLRVSEINWGPLRAALAAYAEVTP